MSDAKRSVMSWLRERFPSVWPTPAPPIIMTEWGPVSEPARLRAALNMRADENIKARVEAMLVKQCGSVEAGMAESRRRYPEAYKGE